MKPKYIILIGGVALGIGSYLYFSSKAKAGAAGGGTVPPAIPGGGDSQDSGLGALFSGIPAQGSQPAATTTQGQQIPCNPPKLLKLSKAASGEIMAEWASTGNLNSVTAQYSQDRVNWTGILAGTASPVSIGRSSNFSRGVTLKAGNGILYVRLVGNCANGQTTAPSEILTFNLIALTG